MTRPASPPQRTGRERKGAGGARARGAPRVGSLELTRRNYRLMAAAGAAILAGYAALWQGSISLAPLLLVLGYCLLLPLSLLWRTSGGNRGE